MLVLTSWWCCLSTSVPVVQCRCYSAHEHPQQQEQQLQPDIKLQTSKRHTLAILAAAAATLTAAGSIRTLPAWAEEAVLSQDMAVQEPVKQLDTTVTHKVSGGQHCTRHESHGLMAHQHMGGQAKSQTPVANMFCAGMLSNCGQQLSVRSSKLSFIPRV